MHHPEVVDPCELLVADNNPGSISSRMIKDLAALVPLLYLAFNEISGTAVKDMVISEARRKYVLCMDCHVMYPPGTLARLLKYFDQHPDLRQAKTPIILGLQRCTCFHELETCLASALESAALSFRPLLPVRKMSREDAA
jgi:hypothetical protein